MSEKSIVENRNVGARWFISLEKELREETGAKYPDKTVIHCALEGFEPDYERARCSLETAKLQLQKLIVDTEKAASGK